jgi:hypothetical protein
MNRRLRLFSRAARLGPLAAVGLALSCGSGPPPVQGDVFIAFGKDFVGFRDWPSETYSTPIAQGLPDAGPTHVAGTRTVFINQLPPAGATAFPLGTIIVKVMEDGAIFARAKRGGGYNKTGARDWEWFEIKEAANAQVAVVWHGVGPPAGEKYAGDKDGGCNGCHKAAVGNDFVLSPWPKLEPAEPGGPADGGVEDGAVDDGGLPTDALID